MDRFGRAWVAVPSMVVLGVSLLLVPLTQSTAALLLVGLLMGVGNGMSSGLVMTLGADLAPPGQRPVFLGRVAGVLPTRATASARSSSPAITAVATLGVGIAAMGACRAARRRLAGLLDPAACPAARGGILLPVGAPIDGADA